MIVNQTYTSIISFNVSIALGVQTILLKVYDSMSNNEAFSEEITGIDITAPQISYAAADLEYTEQEEGNILNWTVFDTYPDVYKIYVDGVEKASGSWESTIVFNVDGLAVGVHTIQLHLWDTSNNLVIDKVTVEVFEIDYIIPTLTVAELIKAIELEKCKYILDCIRCKSR